MKSCPCGTCERKGCGSFHDECGDYQTWLAERPKKETHLYKKWVTDRQWKNRVAYSNRRKNK